MWSARLAIRVSLAVGWIGAWPLEAKAATPHYVDNAIGTGANDGSSWADAWRSLEDIDWSAVHPGDTIYLSGGTGEKIYDEEMIVGASGAAGAEITITRSDEPGHDGRVIIDGGDAARGHCIYVNDHDHLVFRGLELRRAGDADPDSEWGAGIMLHYSPEHVTLDNLDIYENYGRGVLIIGNNSVDEGFCANHITIKNCRITTFADVNSQTDCIYAQHAANLELHDNLIEMKNTSLHNHHSNPIQAHQTRGWRIYNNVIRTVRNGLGEAIILGAEDVAGDPVDAVVIYNNFVYNGGSWIDGYWEGGGTDQWVQGAPYSDVLETRWYGFHDMPPTYIIHNTLVSGGPWITGVNLEYAAVLRNNIIAQFGDGSSPYEWHETFSTGPITPVEDVTDNLFWREWGPISFWGTFTGNGRTGSVTGWASWVDEYGGTGVNADPLFRDPLGGDTARLDAASPAIRAGGDLRSLVEGLGLPWEDIDGNPRDSKPTLGAYEYVPPATETCAELGGVCCAGGQACDGGAFQGATDCSSRCCVGGACGDLPACTENEERGCYSGPAGTAEVGVCESGLQTCSGGAWGGCVGERLPDAAEACDDDLDNDCDGFTDDADAEDCPEVPDAGGDGCGCALGGPGTSPGIAGLLVLAAFPWARARRRE